MGLSKKQQILKDIKNALQIRVYINNEYLKILVGNFDKEKRQLFENNFSLTINFSGMREKIKDEFTGEIKITPNFENEWLKKFLTHDNLRYEDVIKKIDNILLLINEASDEYVIEMKLMYLVSLIEHYANKNEIKLNDLRSYYYNAKCKLELNKYFKKNPSEQAFKSLINKCVECSDLGANNFRQMYELVSNEDMITPQLLMMSSKSEKYLVEKKHNDCILLDETINGYRAYIENIVNIIESKSNWRSLTSDNFDKIAEIFEKNIEFLDVSDKLFAEDVVLSRIWQAYPSRMIDGKVVVNENLTREQVFGFQYKSCTILVKVNLLISSIDDERKTSEKIFAEILNKLEALEKTQNPVIQQPSIVNAGSNPKGQSDESKLATVIIAGMNSDKVDESNQATVVAASSDLSKEDESKQAEIQGLIAIQMQAIKLEKEQRKRLAKQEYDHARLLEQQKNAALAASNEETLEAHSALYPLPSDHYETLCRLFSKDRNKTDFKPAQLIALAEACGAECKSISSGFMVKFKKNHIFIPIASTIIISESLEDCLKSKRDENPVLTFHLQHNKDRNLDRAIVAVFKEALEKAGFTDISCCNYSTSRPKMKC